MRRPRKTTRFFWAATLAPALFASGCFHSRFRAAPRVAVVDGDPIVQMTEPGKLPSLDEPRLVPIEKHTDPPPPSQPVLGLTIGGEQRGYPVGLLETYEVVNDRAADLDYVVARCALTEITAVYDRRVAGRVLTFINSGALWRDTLVLQDRETGTFWTAATGEGLHGPLAGERLRAVPASHSRSGAFRRANPDARYLDTGDSTGTPAALALYAASPWQGVSGIATTDRRYDPKARLFCVADGSEALAFLADDLKRLGRVEETLAGRPIVLEWDSRDESPTACRPEPSGASEEVAVLPIYWFALDRHFATVRTLSDPGARAGANISPFPAAPTPPAAEDGRSPD